jgi:hypothetical protein
MKVKVTRRPQIHVGIAEDDPLRMIGFRALLESERTSTSDLFSLAEMGVAPPTDVVLVTDRTGHNLANETDKVKAALPGTRVLATGSGLDENAILESIALGAKGYISDTASSARSHTIEGARAAVISTDSGSLIFESKRRPPMRLAGVGFRLIALSSTSQIDIVCQTPTKRRTRNHLWLPQRYRARGEQIDRDY